MEKKEELEKEVMEEEKVEKEDSIDEDQLKDEKPEDIHEKDNEVEDLANRLLRLQADFINYKNRVEKDKEKIYTYAAEELMKQLLPILDNFDRALESVEEEDGFYEGVKMIYNQILKVLNENGLKEIECIGEIFDPNFHHAVFAEETEDEEEGTILEVLQKGYLLNDKVIRPSMVKVAK
ncbi:nucleotide exchange factor GrpE [Clostridium sp. Cult2]|uniref:nucleotide exchange factor GrpE n=1 Tax=Clostridium sp. Cult2 TaxID=2079003 RepID=UPI001F02C285|nr:nucleotide exchange factor GrpE [Clostridium sp. Cult2]MCF6465607.1 nucleotide exchange factor GrpE [Clostridium sp. Cult2]